MDVTSEYTSHACVVVSCRTCKLYIIHLLLHKSDGMVWDDRLVLFLKYAYATESEKPTRIIIRLEKWCICFLICKSYSPIMRPFRPMYMHTNSKCISSSKSACMHTYVRADPHTHTHAQICMYMYTYAYMYVHIWTYMCIYEYRYRYNHLQEYIRRYAHTQECVH